jgi:hypothetical protein
MTGTAKRAVGNGARISFKGIGGPTRSEGSPEKLGAAFFADFHRSWRHHGGEVLDRLSIERPEIFFQMMIKLIQVGMLGQPSGLDRRRNRKEVLQRLEDIEQMQRLTNGA